MSGGWNPMTGRDSSGTRPMASLGVPFAGQGHGYNPLSAGPGYGYGTFPPYASWNSLAYGPNLAGTFAQPQVFASPTGGMFYYTYPYAYTAPGPATTATAQTPSRPPQPSPGVDQTMPAAQMTNSSGGVGCEPGYNYFFPAEHTKCHVFYSGTAPWQLPTGAQIRFKATHVPCTVTLAELLKGFGCNAADAKKNRCYEIIPGGNGTWYKGISFSAADKSMMGKTLKEVGWDATRSGNPSEKPVVCLWFCKS